MEIKLGDRTYFISDVCDSSNRRKAALRKDLQEHGPEAFLASRKLSPFAGCVTEELVAAGAEVVFDDQGDEARDLVLECDVVDVETNEEG